MQLTDVRSRFGAVRRILMKYRRFVAVGSIAVTLAACSSGPLTTTVTPSTEHQGG
jgi:hypothetical protein